MAKEEKGKFTGKLGYVLATAGSAVGLGNLWRFPYLTAKYGGGAFLFTYLILVVIFGFGLVLAETAIGRKTGKSSILAFGALSPKHAWIGIIPAIVPVLILPYYSVVGGWVVKYLFGFLSGDAVAMTQNGYFGGYVSQAMEPLVFFFIFFLLTTVIVLGGVEKGIERMSKILMPVLVLLTLLIVIYGLSQPGALEGVKYFILPNFSEFNAKTVLAAMGQMFYSLSISMTILITYGSYMAKDIPMDTSVLQVELFDTCIAILSGLMIIPAVFVFSNGDLSNLHAGPSLMFVTLPKVFASMKGGAFVGIVFFILTLFAALTSSVSLLESVTSIFMDKWNLTRKKSIAMILIFSIIVGSLSSLGFGSLSSVHILSLSIFDFLDTITNSVMMPIAALLTCYFVSRVIGCDSISDEVKISSPFKMEKLFTFTITSVAPICIIVVLISSILQTVGILSV